MLFFFSALYSLGGPLRFFFRRECSFFLRSSAIGSYTEDTKLGELTGAVVCPVGRVWQVTGCSSKGRIVLC